ncbi:MAG: sulfatase-like hydrolase/transferase [Bryobacteraceae bacterium]|nr:sulfatase-like hydrolase/transferase [Bryobacteraceae bacterium]
MIDKSGSRRQFLKATPALGAGLAGCARPAAPPAEPEPSGSIWQRPPRQQGNGWNVILLVSDTFRADNLACYGSKWVDCPHLNAFAREAVIFDDAYPEGMPTIPIRRTLMTGRRIVPFYYHRQHEPVQLPGWHELYNEDVTLSETLKEAGYTSALIADVPHMQRPSRNFHRGFDYYEWIRGQEVDSYTTAPRKMPAFTDLFPESYLSRPEHGEGFTRFLNQYKRNRLRWLKHGESLVEQVAKAAMAWLQENRGEAPFYLHVEAFDPHEPWDPPRRFLEKYMPGASGPSWPEPPYGDIKVPPEGVARFRANYAGESSCVDFWFGRILKTIADLGLYGNSIVVFMADHGALLGEQGEFLKGPTRLRGQVTHIPLLIRMPGKEGAGQRVKGFVQIPDIVPTILGRLNLKPDPRVTGADLWPLATGQTKSIRDHAVQAYGWIAAVRTSEWNYSRAWRPEKLDRPYAPQLYNLEQDPEELVNVAAKYAAVTAELDRKLDEYIASGLDLTSGSFHEQADRPAGQLSRLPGRRRGAEA